MKTRDAGRLRLAAARYLFARYPVAEHLEQVWLNPGGLNRDEIKLRKRWYIVAAGGGSLYKEGASAWLSRKEVHAFLNPLGHLGFDEAIWQAIARSYADDPAIAMRTARSRIVDTPRAELGFWREAVRFFCAHPTTVEEMDERQRIAAAEGDDADIFGVYAEPPLAAANLFHVRNGRVVDGTGRTSVTGVWAAGNAADPRAQVITAAGQGSAAAIAINADLVREDVAVCQGAVAG